MSAVADIIRDRRRLFAAPGGSHDRMVGFLGKALPALIGVLLAFMMITPFSPRGDVSFLLDRDQVAIVPDRLRVDNAMYRGTDEKGRPFSLTAARAVQRSASEAIVRMNDLSARILLNDGPAVLVAQRGRYDIDNEKVRIDGPVQLTAADGYRMVARNVDIDLEARTMAGRGAVDGAVPAGTFSADSIYADLSARTVTLAGHANLRMRPGKLRIPQ